ncbi:trafficking kinesin-binding protein 1 [Camelus ferus]|nr:trafficking kinesin-binding protein 1 [Camelus ferus]
MCSFGIRMLMLGSSHTWCGCQVSWTCLFQNSGSGASDGSRHLPVKPAKLDATALHDDTLANPVPPSEACNHAVLACSLGIPEELYVSEAVEDAPRCRGYRDACTITDVCNSTDLPEVEIISLLEEQLPHYRLRADTIYGYDHDDWLHTPLISPDANIDLTTEQIEETLKYFLSSIIIRPHVPFDNVMDFRMSQNIGVGAMSLRDVGGEEECFEYDCQDEETKPIQEQHETLDLLEEAHNVGAHGETRHPEKEVARITRLSDTALLSVSSGEKISSLCVFRWSKELHKQNAFFILGLQGTGDRLGRVENGQTQKERDLELAARIGQSLLKKNKTLTERNELLEEQVEHIREEVSQLRHELSMKDELLQFYTSAAEESEPESVCSTPLKRNESSSSVQNYFHLDSLQKKLKDLEEENVVLRSEACQLKTETITYEEKEQQLVNDCVKELSTPRPRPLFHFPHCHGYNLMHLQYARDANVQIASISEELAKKTEDAARQQEEITHLLSQIVDLQKKAKACAVENEELVQHLGAAKDAQRQLTAELRELEDKYAECMEMLHEAQEELKNLRNKTVPSTASRRYHSLGLFPMDSLAAEIEGTMRKELQLEEPESPDIAYGFGSQLLGTVGHQKRVFETVRNINQVVKQRSLTPSPMNIPGSNQSSAMNSLLSSCVSTPRSSFYGSDVGNVVLDNKTNSIILEAESADLGNEEPRSKKPGTPGTPGSHDLETALRRLSLRRENYLSERRFFEEEQERKLRELAEKGELLSGSLTPTESIMSLGTHSRFSEFTGFSGMSFSSRSYLPEKLQIVKPLEGDHRGPRPLSALLGDSLWSLIHHRKAGNLCNAYSFFFRDSHPRCWFEFL